MFTVCRRSIEKIDGSGNLEHSLEESTATLGDQDIGVVSFSVCFEYPSGFAENPGPFRRGRIRP